MKRWQKIFWVTFALLSIVSIAILGYNTWMYSSPTDTWWLQASDGIAMAVGTVWTLVFAALTIQAMLRRD